MQQESKKKKREKNENETNVKLQQTMTNVWTKEVQLETVPKAAWFPVTSTPEKPLPC